MKNDETPLIMDTAEFDAVFEEYLKLQEAQILAFLGVPLPIDGEDRSDELSFSE